MPRLRSSRPRRQPKTSILIATNGKVTERMYLNGLKLRMTVPGLHVKIHVVNGEPEAMIKKLSSPNGDTAGYDEVWLVVDEDGADRTALLTECVTRSRYGQKWRAIISRPSFEVWLVAHYEAVRNYANQADAQAHFARLAQRRESDKFLPSDFPFDRVGDAIVRCHLHGASLRPLNTLPAKPGTAMPHLVRRLIPDLA